jgi:hypothetical protein
MSKKSHPPVWVSQNFLTSAKIIRRLIRKTSIDSNDHVIEIGPGKGHITGALLQSNTQANHALIGDSITPFNRTLFTGHILHFWSPENLHGAAVLNEEITRQASTIAYVDDFKLMLVLALAAMPFVFFLRTEPQRPAASGHAAME